jgi:hypothetical protein
MAKMCAFLKELHKNTITALPLRDYFDIVKCDISVFQCRNVLVYPDGNFIGEPSLVSCAVLQAFLLAFGDRGDSLLPILGLLHPG